MKIRLVFEKQEHEENMPDIYDTGSNDGAGTQ